MRVAIFTETYLPDTNGVATHIKTLRDGLVSLGHSVLIIRADCFSRRSRIKDGIMCCPAVKSGKKLYNYSVSSPVSIKRLCAIKKWNPDIIHIQNEFGIGLSGVFIAKALKKPLVYTIHTMYDDYICYIAKKPLLPLASKLSRRYLRSIADSASAITGASLKISDYLKSCGVKKAVNIIPNSVELDLFGNADAFVADKLRASLSVPDNKTLVCFCGRLGSEKSADILLKNWKYCVDRNNSFFLIIIGDGPEKSSLEELSSSLGISDSVLFLGKIPHSELAPYYAMCDAYITASLSENHSISMLEAMASGLPVIHAYDEKNECQTTEGLNGFSFRSPEEMLTALERIRAISDKNALRKAVRKSVENSGSDSLAKYFSSLYSRVCENHEKAV